MGRMNRPHDLSAKPREETGLSLLICFPTLGQFDLKPDAEPKFAITQWDTNRGNPDQ